MTTSRITEKISKLVSSQLPEFLRNDYPLFVSFIEAYYRYLEQDQQALEIVQNALSYNDIDRTASSFVNYFLQNYAKHVPLTTALNKKFLVKRINDLYESKGSELSFKLLFSLLYDVTVEQSHPYDYVLRPSDGIWDQRVSLRVEKVSGSIDNLTDRFIHLTKNKIEYKDAIIRVKNLSTNLYEVFLKSTTSTPYEVGDEIVVKDENNDIVFIGVIKPTATEYSISSPGIGFRVGQVFTISLAGAVDTVIRILKVDENGGIQLLKILNYGYGFTGQTLSIDLYNDLTVASRTEKFSTKAGGFIDNIIITQPHTLLTAGRYFFSDYVVNSDYTGATLVNKIDDFSVAQVNQTGIKGTGVATISFTLGAIARYPGQYLSSKGFISEPAIRLQDDKLYQPFAYQLSSELDISYFYDTVINLIHPAGTNLFNNRTISNFANLRSNVHVETRANIFLELEDTFSLQDVPLRGYFRNLSNTVSTSDTLSFNYNSAAADEATVSDTLAYVLNRGLEDNVSASDSISLALSIVLSDTANVIDSFDTVTSYARTIDDTVSPEESIAKSLTTSFESNNFNFVDTAVVGLALAPVNDSLTSDDTTVLSINKSIIDEQTLLDAEFKSIYKDINNVSNVTLTESITAQTTSYAVPGYFSELYAGSLVTLA